MKILFLILLLVIFVRSEKICNWKNECCECPHESKDCSECSSFLPIAPFIPRTTDEELLLFMIDASLQTKKSLINELYEKFRLEKLDLLKDILNHVFISSDKENANLEIILDRFNYQKK